MMRFMCKRRGAISIFLIIVLLPMMMISAIFVDESRIQLAKSIVSSAGDITLNSALTDYDSVLKDMYGLFASSQDIDEIYDKLEEYYKHAIMTAGIDEEDADDYVGQIMSYVKSETGSDDLMKLNLTDFKIGQSQDGNLANPAQMKAQIVEFMKYRGPLSLGTGLLDGLKSMKNLEKQSKNVDNKNKFYKQQQSLLEKLESAWWEIQKYQYKDANDKKFPSADYFNTNNTDMNDNKSKVESAVSDTIKYLHFDGSKLGYGTCSIEYDPNDNDTTWDDEWTFYFNGTEQSTSKKYKKTSTNVTTQKIIDCLNTANSAYQKFKDSKESSDNTKFAYYCQSLPQDADSWSDVKWMYVLNKFNEEIDSGYAYYAKEFWKSIIDLQSAMEHSDSLDTTYVVRTDSDNKFKSASSDTSGKVTLEKACNDIIGNIIKDTTNDDGSHTLSLANDYVVFNNMMSRLEAGASKISGIYDRKKEDVESNLKTVRDEANDYYNLVNEKISNLSTAVTLLTEVKSDLQNDSSSYNTAKSNWNTTANQVKDTSMGENDITELKNLESTIKADEIEKLITRLNAAKTSLENVRGQIEAYKLGSTQWKEFGDNPGSGTVTGVMSDDQKNTMNNIIPSRSDGSDYDSLISEVKAQISTGNLNMDWTDSSNPDLTKEMPNFYKWLYNNYYDSGASYDESSTATTKVKDATDKADYKNEVSKLEKTGKDKPEPERTKKLKTDVGTYKAALPSGGNTQSENAIKTAEDGISDKSSEDLASSSASSGIIEQILSAASDLGTKARDNMYITSYVMGMFSYDTYENEIVKKEGGTAKGSWYNDDGSVKSDFSSYLSKAKSITKTDIKPENNYLYGSEVEYIIYGGDSSTSGINKTYGTIFLIRFALNSVYAFTDAEINTIATSAATALFGVPPLTPLIPIAKIAITLALVVAESTYDLYQLKMGEAVPLVKNNTTWVMKPSSALGEVIEKVSTDVVNEGYKKLNDLLEMTDEQLTNIINDGEDKIGKLASSAVDAATEKIKSYAKEATDQVITFINNVNLEYLDSASDSTSSLDYSDAKKERVIEYLDRWLEESKSDTTIYNAKKVAVDYLKEGSTIKDLFEKVKETASNGVISGQTALEQDLTYINTQIGNKIEEITNTVGTELNNMKNECADKIKEAAKDGAESLKKELKNQIGNVFTGTSEKIENGKDSVIGNLLSWRYSDYLSLFLFISTMVNDEAVLYRISDVIQLNIEHINKKYATTADDNSAFVMKKASTYLTMEATVQVKPMMLAMPFMEDTTKSNLTGTSWYTIKYKGTLGY